MYREVVLSFTFNRVLDKNFTFFKSKIHSNWHIFNLTTNHSRLFTVRYSVFSNPYSIFGIHHSPLTTHHSRLTCHFEWFSNENLIEKCFEVLRLDEFSIQISLFSKAKFTRIDMYSSSPLKTHSSLRVIFDRKLYREVLWSLEIRRVLDTNFTFFKSKIHSNWHVFKLTSQNSLVTSHSF